MCLTIRAFIPNVRFWSQCLGLFQRAVRLHWSDISTVLLWNRDRALACLRALRTWGCAGSCRRSAGLRQRASACACGAGPVRRAEQRVCGPCAPLPARCAPREALLPRLRSAAFPLTLNSAAVAPGGCERRGPARAAAALLPVPGPSGGPSSRVPALPPPGPGPPPGALRPRGRSGAPPAVPPPAALQAQPPRGNQSPLVRLHPSPGVKATAGLGAAKSPVAGSCAPPASRRCQCPGAERSAAELPARPGPSASSLPPGSAGSLPRLHARRPSCPLVVSLLSFFYFSPFFFNFFFPSTGNAQSGLMDISELCISDPLGYHNQWVRRVVPRRDRASRGRAGTGTAAGGSGRGRDPARLRLAAAIGAGGCGQVPRGSAGSRCAGPTLYFPVTSPSNASSPRNGLTLSAGSPVCAVVLPVGARIFITWILRRL